MFILRKESRIALRMAVYWGRRIYTARCLGPGSLRQNSNALAACPRWGMYPQASGAADGMAPVACQRRAQSSRSSHWKQNHGDLCSARQGRVAGVPWTLAFFWKYWPECLELWHFSGNMYMNIEHSLYSAVDSKYSKQCFRDCDVVLYWTALFIECSYVNYRGCELFWSACFSVAEVFRYLGPFFIHYPSFAYHLSSQIILLCNSFFILSTLHYHIFDRRSLYSFHLKNNFTGWRSLDGMHVLTLYN